MTRNKTNAVGYLHWLSVERLWCFTGIPAFPIKKEHKEQPQALQLSSSPANVVTSAFKTRCCFSNKKILAEQLKSVRLRSFFVVPGASEVYRDAMIQPLRWCTSQISSQRGSSIFTCEQDLTTKPNKWGASHLPLLLDRVMSLWSRASWDVCFLHPCTAPHLPNYIYTQASQPTQLY